MDRLARFLEFLQNEPNDPFLKYALATEYVRLNQTEEALKYYLDLVDKHTDYIGTYYHLGKLYEQLNKQDDAIKTYEQGIEVGKRIKDQHALSELLGAYNSLRDEMEDW